MVGLITMRIDAETTLLPMMQTQFATVLRNINAGGSPRSYY